MPSAMRVCGLEDGSGCTCLQDRSRDAGVERDAWTWEGGGQGEAGDGTDVCAVPSKTTSGKPLGNTRSPTRSAAMLSRAGPGGQEGGPQGPDACVPGRARSRLTVTPWTTALQAPPSTEVFRQEYWSELPFRPPGDLLNPDAEHVSPCLLYAFSLFL